MSMKEKDSPKIHREGGVEDGSDVDLKDFDPSMNRTMRTEQRQNSFSCEQCNKYFSTFRGLRIHQGKTCKKKERHCRSKDRKTRSQSSRDENHSGVITASVDPNSNERSILADHQPQEVEKRTRIV